MSLRGPVLVTGTAGFIGFHVARRLLEQGCAVFGVDNMSSYYDPALKQARCDILSEFPDFRFAKLDIADQAGMAKLFSDHKFPYVVHLAAQAGVRYSIENPQSYVSANLQGFANVLEGCRNNACKHLIFASSSSVYGANARLPFRTTDDVSHPLSLYGASKKANEAMAHAYANLFNLPATGLRFFTVYGPWGRPDMAMWVFVSSILAGKPIKLFNHGDMSRDFTYVDDVVESIVRLIEQPAAPDPTWSALDPNPARSYAPWRIYNIGNNNPIQLLDLVAMIESKLGKKAVRELLPMQPGDVHSTFADIEDLSRDVGFHPSTPVKDGVEKFIDWYREYHRI